MGEIIKFGKNNTRLNSTFKTAIAPLTGRLQGDFNGDGRTDLALVNLQPTNPPTFINYLYLADNTGSLISTSSTLLPENFQPSQMYPGDYNGDGINDEFCINVENADSWEFEAFDLSGTPIFQSAGTISGNTACMWDGSGAYCWDYYACIIRFKNSYGRAIENAYMVYVICDTKSANISVDSLLIKVPKNVITFTDEFSDSEPKIEIYPNPSGGIFFIKSSNNFLDGIKIYNSFGQLICEETNINSSEYQINLGDSSKGIYFVKISVNNQLITRKIIIK